MSSISFFFFRTSDVLSRKSYHSKFDFGHFKLTNCLINTNTVIATRKKKTDNILFNHISLTLACRATSYEKEIALPNIPLPPVYQTDFLLFPDLVSASIGF